MTIKINIELELDSNSDISDVKDIINFLSTKNVTFSSLPCIANNSTTIIDLIDAKINTCRKLNTKRGYMRFRKWWCSNFPHDTTIGDIDYKLASEFRTILYEDNSKSNSTKNLYINWMSGVLTNAFQSGLVDFNPKPLIKKFKVSQYKNRYLSVSELTQIFKLWRDIEKTHTKKCTPAERDALSLFILSILLQGLSPIDIANLKISDLHVSKIKINSRLEPIFILDTYRAKTGNPIRIIMDKKYVMPILQIFLINKYPSDYIINCFDKSINYTPAQKACKLSNWYFKKSKDLNAILRREEIIYDNRKVTYYFARHAYCNLLDHLEVAPHIIRQLVGHSQTVLEKSYLRPLTPERQWSISTQIAKFIIHG